MAYSSQKAFVVLNHQKTHYPQPGIWLYLNAKEVQQQNPGKKEQELAWSNEKFI